MASIGRARIRTSDGSEIAVQVTGSPTGPLVVLANGLGGSMAAWQPLIDHLAPRFRIASWDYRGLYESPPPADPGAVTIDHHCGDLASLLEWLGGGPAAVIGWSMGVQVAVEFALQRPADTAGLVLVCGAPGDPLSGVFHTAASRWLVPPLARVVGAVRLPIGPVLRALADWPPAPSILHRAGLLAPTADVDIARDVARGFADLDMQAYARIVLAMAHHDPRPRLGEIRAPTLVVAGGRDLFLPVRIAEATAAAIPGAELLVLPRATHYAPLEAPGELNRRIERFLAERVMEPTTPR